MPSLPHVAHVPTPFAGDGSSIAHVVRALTREHAARGGRSTVVVSDNREATFDDADSRPVDYTRNCPRTCFSPWEYRQDFLLGALLRERPHTARLFEPAAEALAEVAPDWVVVHEGIYAVTSLPVFRRLLPDRTRIALHLHNAVSASVRRPELTRLLRHTDVVLGCSTFMTDGLRARARVAPETLATVHNGVDTGRFQPGPPADRASDGGRLLRLLYVGQVAPHKGVHLLLEALAALGEHASRFETRIVGSAELRDTDGLNDYERRLREVAATCRGPVAFEPYQPQHLVPDLYRWADVVAVPSRAEPFGMVPVEAMATGAHVLAHRSGALPEVLGDAGRLVEPTVAGWVDALSAVRHEDVASGREAAVARAHELSWARSHAMLLDAFARADDRRVGRAGAQRPGRGSSPTFS